MDSFDKENAEINTIIVAANAQMFCLMIRQNILQGQAQRITEEIQVPFTS